MLLLNLSLEGFRSYRRLEAAFPTPFVLLQGRNAAGKSNLLEAIALLCTGRSYRSARDLEMVNWGVEGYSIQARFQNDGLSNLLQLYYGPGGRSLFLDGFACANWGEMTGQFPAVIFSPDDLQLLKGPPSLRRRFLDLILLQLQRPYRHHLRQYLRVLTQRNNLLRRLTPGEQAAAQLDIWDEQLVEHGSQVIRRRLGLLATIGPILDESYEAISGSREPVVVSYLTDLAIPSQAELPEIAGAFRRRLQQLRRLELSRGVTLAGPQRDDVLFLLDGRDARFFASQGQQRTLTLTVKLAEVALLREQLGRPPLFLLDDVLSELDPQRRRCLLAALPGASQAFITCTHHEEEFCLLNSDLTTIFEVKDGGLLSAAPAG